MATQENASQPSPAQLRAAYQVARRYFRRPYVTGVTIGEVIRGGRLQEGGWGICIHVEEKLAERHLRAQQVFPRQILGVPVDVVERIHRPHDLSGEEILVRQIVPRDTLCPGISISTEDGHFGTLGMIVFDRVDGRSCILSAAHVLRDGTSTTVLQPGSEAGGVAIGRVARSLLDSDGDAAIARLNASRPLDPEPLGLILAPGSIQRVQPSQRLQKSGARTGVTEGVVTSIGEITVAYDDGSSVTMQGFEVRPVHPESGDEVSDEGDSGSIWMDATTGVAVGLTVGGDRLGADHEFALACHLDLVFKRLQITLDPHDHV